MSDEIKNEFLEREHMRALAAHILDQIPHGDINENIQQVGSFNTHMVAGLLFGGASSVEHAINGLDALYDDVEMLIRTNFDAAKAAMEESDAKPN
jgi:3-isopropylmalate dehydratase small subunit